MKQRRCCTCCKHSYPLDARHFHRNRAASGGFTYVCKPCSREYDRARYRANHTEEKARRHRRYWTDPDRARIQQREYMERTREAVLQAYGAVYECCGQDGDRFLTLDHAGGPTLAQEITEGKKFSGLRLYLAILREGCPPGFRVLCFNCNCARALNDGTCPHKENR